MKRRPQLRNEVLRWHIDCWLKDHKVLTSLPEPEWIARMVYDFNSIYSPKTNTETRIYGICKILQNSGKLSVKPLDFWNNYEYNLKLMHDLRRAVTVVYNLWRAHAKS